MQQSHKLTLLVGGRASACSYGKHTVKTTKTNQEIIDELKRESEVEPFVLLPNGLPLKMPTKIFIRVLLIEGRPYSVGFTFDVCPSTGLEVEHLSIAGLQMPVPDNVQQEILLLAFGKVGAGLAKKHDSPLGRTHQWLLINRRL